MAKDKPEQSWHDIDDSGPIPEILGLALAAYLLASIFFLFA